MIYAVLFSFCTEYIQTDAIIVVENVNLFTRVKQYEDKMAVYAYFLIKAITDRLFYAPTLILMIYAVSVYLVKRYFLYSTLRTARFVTEEHGNVQSMTLR